jgi:thymidylate kinase
MKNKFIVIEGCDFTGKSTVIDTTNLTVEKIVEKILLDI